MSRCHHTFEILRDAAGNPSLVECPACGAWWHVESIPENAIHGPCAGCGSEAVDPGESLCVDCASDEAEAASTVGAHDAGIGGTGLGLEPPGLVLPHNTGDER